MVIEETADTPIYEVGEFYELLTAHLESGFGRRRPHWVRGEIAKVYEKGHVYIDLVDAGTASSDTRRPVLNAHCWQTPWAPLKRKLAAEGMTLKPGMRVSFFGYVDVYAPQGKIGFTITDIDVQDLLGDVARRRQELIARLIAEGLMDRNKTVPLVRVPLRVGLVASPGTEGYADFTGQLLNSGFSFSISLIKSLVQGDQAPEQIAAALASFDPGEIDMICLVRGGGSKGDLACFDDERVARAIAFSPIPVFTGIGHTGDESIADLVAHTRAITPTKLGEEIVAIVGSWYESNVRLPASRLLLFVGDLVDESEQYLAERRRTMIFAVRDRLRAEERHLDTTRDHLVREARHLLRSASQAIASQRQLLGAYDPVRRLAQGWSIVTNAEGSVVTSINNVQAGEALRLRVANGTITTTVEGKEESI